MNKSIFIFPFVLAPILAIIITSVFNIGFYNMLSAVTWFGAIIVIFDKLGKRDKIVFPIYLKYLLAFILYTIVSDYLLVGKTITIKYIYSNYLLSGFLAALMVENIKVSASFIKKASFLCLLFLLFAFFVIIYQQTINSFFLVNTNSLNTMSDLEGLDEIQKRLPSIYSWSSLMDLNYGFIGIATLIISKYMKENKSNYNVIALIAMTLIFSFLTRGRWMMINALLLLLMYFIFKGVNIKNIFVYGLLSFFVFIAMVQSLEFFNVPVTKIIDERILENNKGSIEEKSAGSRIFAFAVFGKLFPEHPIFGKGLLHSFGGQSKDFELVHALGGRSSQIHVGYLTLLYYYGIVGALPFLLFLYHLLKKLLKEAKQSQFYGAFFVFIGFALSNWTLVNFTIFYYGLTLAIVYHNFYFEKYKFDFKKA